MITWKQGDLFASGLPAIGHGVNCRGVMGAGIAAQFKIRYPDMYESYRKRCLRHAMIPGEIMPWKDDRSGLVIFNLATQDQPGADAQPWMITAAVGRMITEAVNDFGLAEVGLPWIGCGIGGLCLNDLKAALAPYRDAPVHLTLFELSRPGAPPRCDYGHGSPTWCTAAAVWLNTWECDTGHQVYRRLCEAHDLGIGPEKMPPGMCGHIDAGGMCVRQAILISRTKPQR